MQRGAAMGIVVGLLLGGAAGCVKKSRQPGQGGTGGAGEPSPSPGVLTELVSIGARLEDGFTAVTAGTEPAQAFGDWTVTAAPDVAPAMQAAHGVSARLIGFELELVMGGPGRNDFLRTMVHATRREQAFVALSVRSDTSVTGVPVEHLTGALAPVAAGVRALLGTGADCSKLVVARDGFIDQFGLPPSLKLKLGKMLTESREAHAEVCRLLAAHREPIQIHLDDVAVAILGQQGQLVGGVRAQFGIDERGRLELHLKRFEPAPAE